MFADVIGVLMCAAILTLSLGVIVTLVTDDYVDLQLYTPARLFAVGMATEIVLGTFCVSLFMLYWIAHLVYDVIVVMVN